MLPVAMVHACCCRAALGFWTWLRGRRTRSGEPTPAWARRWPAWALPGQHAACRCGATIIIRKKRCLCSGVLTAVLWYVQLPLLYLKPVQTGYPADSDARSVVSSTSSSSPGSGLAEVPWTRWFRRQEKGRGPKPACCACRHWRAGPPSRPGHTQLCCWDLPGSRNRRI